MKTVFLSCTDQEIYSSFSEAFIDTGLFKHVTFPTFIKSNGTSSNILDLVVTEDKHRLIEIDHLPPLGQDFEQEWRRFCNKGK